MLYIHNNKLLVLASVLFLLAITIPLSVVLSQQPSRSQSSAQAQKIETTLNFTIYFHGIGESGDSLSPGNTKFSTKEPTFNKKNITINIYNASNQLVLSKSGSLGYKNEQGYFSGAIAIGNTLPAGSYNIKVSSPSYLWKKIPGAITITPQTDNKAPAITMIAGDFNGDNLLNTLDYNILMGCYSDLLDAAFCDESTQTKTDISADFDVNFKDYNLFLREIAKVQRGE